MAQAVKCPKCAGSGKQTDWTFVGITNVFWPAFRLMDKLLTDGEVGEEECSRCNGKGFLRVDPDDLDRC